MKSKNELAHTAGLMIKETVYDGGFGYIFKKGKKFATVVWSNGGSWEHVSMAPLNRRLTPSWQDMCDLKDMFFYDDEVVVQYHPVKSEYVNNKKNCLHLWRPIKEVMPTPPSIMVGIKDGQSRADVNNAIKDLYAHSENKNAIWWHPYPEEKPEREGRYLVTLVDNFYYKSDHKPYIRTRCYEDGNFDCEDDFDTCIAWAELPEPYKESEAE